MAAWCVQRVVMYMVGYDTGIVTQEDTDMLRLGRIDLGIINSVATSHY